MKTCTVDGAPVAYTDVGQGPVLLFVHGVYVTGALWDDLTARLSDRFRCIAPTWPLGAQDQLADDADVGAAASARRIAHFVEQLELDDVTIVANDTGGGIVLTMLGDQTLDLSWIGGLVLTNSDSYEHFPPGLFRPIVKICRASAGIGGVILARLASKRGQKVFLKAVCKKPISADRQAEIFGAFATSKASRKEGVRTTATLDPTLTLAASDAIEKFNKPVLLAWATDDDLFFPLSHAERLHDAFPNSNLVTIPHSATYVMLDAPDQLAAAIAAFIKPG